MKKQKALILFFMLGIPLNALWWNMWRLILADFFGAAGAVHSGPHFFAFFLCVLAFMFSSAVVFLIIAELPE